MDVKRAVSRGLLGVGLLLAAPGLTACDGDPGTGNQEVGGEGTSFDGPVTSGDPASGVGADEGGGSAVLEATGRAEDTGDRAGHGSGEESGEGESGASSSEPSPEG